MRPLVLALFLLASGAVAQEADSPEAGCDGDALLLERAPTLHEMLRDAAWVEVIIASPAEGYKDDVSFAATYMAEYACVYTASDTLSADDLYGLVSAREALVELLAEPVGIWSAALDLESFAGTEGEAMRAAFTREVTALGFRPVYADGGIASLSFGPAELAMRPDTPGDIGLYVGVQEAVGRTSPFELDVGDLLAEADVLGRTEVLLRDFPSSIFAPEAYKAHTRALSLLASLHPVEGEDSWQVAAGNGSGLPMGGKRSALEHFVETYPASRYAPVFQAILADPPLAVAGGEIDVIVVGRSQTDEGAQAQALARLDAGIDVVGALKLSPREWGVAFRYYPTGDPRLDAAETRARDLGLTPEHVRINPGRLNRIDWR